MRFVLALVMMTAVAQADESWPTFGNPYVFTEQGGEAIYRSVCAGCHMPHGRGASGAGTYPSLADDARLAVSSYPIRMVLKGQKAMPPFSDSLTNEQVAAVVTYIRTHFGNGFTDAPRPADVAAQR
jgi:mono/diheme cytochrome c family protein